MNEAVLLWILGGLLGGILTIAKLLWDHVQHCKEVHERLAEIGADVKRLVVDVGTHETGLRGHVHTVAKFADQLEKRVYVLERNEAKR